ncbi:MAG: hypothetical protein PVG04_07650, partial [Anaerolineales bacterium]
MSILLMHFYGRGKKRLFQEPPSHKRRLRKRQQPGISQKRQSIFRFYCLDIEPEVDQIAIADNVF